MSKHWKQERCSINTFRDEAFSIEHLVYQFVFLYGSGNIVQACAMPSITTSKTQSNYRCRKANTRGRFYLCFGLRKGHLKSRASTASSEPKVDKIHIYLLPLFNLIQKPGEQFGQLFRLFLLHPVTCPFHNMKAQHLCASPILHLFQGAGRAISCPIGYP